MQFGPYIMTPFHSLKNTHIEQSEFCNFIPYPFHYIAWVYCIAEFDKYSELLPANYQSQWIKSFWVQSVVFVSRNLELSSSFVRELSSSFVNEFKTAERSFSYFLKAYFIICWETSPIGIFITSEFTVRNWDYFSAVVRD